MGLGVYVYVDAAVADIAAGESRDILVVIAGSKVEADAIITESADSGAWGLLNASYNPSALPGTRIDWNGASNLITKHPPAGPAGSGPDAAVHQANVRGVAYQIQVSAAS